MTALSLIDSTSQLPGNDSCVGRAEELLQAVSVVAIATNNVSCLKFLIEIP